MLKDIKSHINAALSLTPSARTTTANGSTIDTQGFGSAAFLVGFGTWTDGTHTPSAQESDDGSAWTTIVAADLDGVFAAVTSAAGNGTLQRVGYLGAKRYVRIVITISGATTGATSTAVVVRGHPVQQPQ